MLTVNKINTAFVQQLPIIRVNYLKDSVFNLTRHLYINYNEH